MLCIEQSQLKKCVASGPLFRKGRDTKLYEKMGDERRRIMSEATLARRLVRSLICYRSGLLPPARGAALRERRYKRKSCREKSSPRLVQRHSYTQDVSRADAILAARAEADVHKGERLAVEFLDKIVQGSTGLGNTDLAAVALSQAYFVQTSDKLGVLSANAGFFEFDPNSAHHNVRAVMFRFIDGPDQLEMMLKSCDRGSDFLWVNYALNASSTNFDAPTPATVAMVNELVASAPSLTQSTAFVTHDYREYNDRSRASAEATQTLLVFVTVAVGDGGEAVVRGLRLRGANLVCGNENCKYHRRPAKYARRLCRLCHGMYICRSACNITATTERHFSVCQAIRATHRAWLYRRRLPDVPKYLVPNAVETSSDDEEETTDDDDEEVLPLAAEGEEQPQQRLLPPNSHNDVSTDDEAVPDTQPEEDVMEVVKETPLPSPAAAPPAAARELFAQHK